MPADDAASAGVNGANRSRTSNPHPNPLPRGEGTAQAAGEGEQQRQHSQQSTANGSPATSGERDDNRAKNEGSTTQKEGGSVVETIASKLGLPLDVAQQIDARSREGAEDAEAQPEGAEHSQEGKESNEGPHLNPLPGGEEDATAPGEGEHDASGKGNPFNDPRVKERLGKEARKRERLMRAAGLSEAEIEEIQQSKDPVAAAEEAIAGRLQTSTAEHRTPNAEGMPQGPSVAPGQGGMLANCVNETQVDGYANWARNTLAWCRQNRDGVTVGEKFYSPEEISDFREQANQIMLEVPERRREIRDALRAQQEAATPFNARAQKEYPALFDKEHADHAKWNEALANDDVLRGFIRRNPNAAYDPAINLLLGGYVAGKVSHPGAARRAAATANPDLPESLTRQHPPIAPHTPARPPARSAAPHATKSLEQARERVFQGGGTEAVREFMRNAAKAERKDVNGRQPALV